MNNQQSNLAGNPYWDLDGALIRVNQDEKLLREIAGIFLERMAVALSNIELALEEDANEMLTMSAHTLKGSAGNISANTTMEIAGRLEELSEKGEFASIALVWKELQQETAHLRLVISNWLESV